MDLARGERWTIVAVSDDGEQAEIAENEHATLHTLLVAAVHRLDGEHAEVAKYEIVIAGVPQEDLHLTLAQAGLHNGAEVVVHLRDVHRG